MLIALRCGSRLARSDTDIFLSQLFSQSPEWILAPYSSPLTPYMHSLEGALGEEDGSKRLEKDLQIKPKGPRLGVA